ncbi:ParB/RepB/Spo0J family partition protein [Streptomyces triculaminicus]|uniref:ParB/RepB/Spo0J family partition protein n=1 Tax=Streptomyces triculaminicus TaxID=2816232 RepID=UPI0037D22F41
MSDVLARTEFVPVGTLLPADSPRLAGENVRHTRMLAESGGALPPIVVHRPTMRIVDGVHRHRAAQRRGDARIEVRFVEGTPEDAFVLAVRLNTTQGMPLTHEDRTAAAARILVSHPHWSDRRIAALTGVSASVVAQRRRSIGRDKGLSARTGRDGRVRPLNAADGRRRAVQYITDRPGASLREIAQVAGVAVATARDVRERLRHGEDPVPAKLRAAEGSTGDEVPMPFDSGSAMRRDPSLRFSESGRTLLRLLSFRSLDGEKLRWLAESVPPHRTADVAQAARRCAEQWLKFARDIEQRGTERRSAARGELSRS